jgi:alcohol dehydrogenase class IV
MQLCFSRPLRAIACRPHPPKFPPCPGFLPQQNIRCLANGSIDYTFYDKRARSDRGAAISGAGRSVKAVVQRITTLRTDIGLVTRLRDVRVGKNELQAMAQKATVTQFLLDNNPRDMSEADILDIYRAAY